MMRHTGRENLALRNGKIIGRHSCAHCMKLRKLFWDSKGEYQICYDCSQNEILLKALTGLVQGIDERWKKTVPPKQLLEPLNAAKEVLGRQ